jgi:hypothetical protein
VATDCSSSSQASVGAADAPTLAQPRKQRSGAGARCEADDEGPVAVPVPASPAQPLIANGASTDVSRARHSFSASNDPSITRLRNSARSLMCGKGSSGTGISRKSQRWHEQGPPQLKRG